MAEVCRHSAAALFVIQDSLESFSEATDQNPIQKEDVIRRPRYRKVPRDRGPRKNEEIKISPLRVIGADNRQIGVLERDEALRLAQEAGLDLIEIEPKIRPPVCKIMDYGKYKYDKSKQKSAQNKVKKNTETKEVRLGRSVKIDGHDLGVRMNQAKKFLQSGHRVRITQRFRGREMAHTEIGFERMQKIAEELGEMAKVIVEPKLIGRQISMELVPDKAKMQSSEARSAS